MQHGETARARAVEDGRGPVLVAHTPHLARDLVERFAPADALEVAGAARAHPPQRVEEPVRMVDALQLPEAPHAGVERRHLGRPLPGIGADLDDAAVAHVGVDDAAATAVVAARARDDRLAGPRGP